MLYIKTLNINYQSLIVIPKKEETHLHIQFHHFFFAYIIEEEKI